MGYENDIIYALVTAVRHDLKRGIKKEDILYSLSNVISKELFDKVIDRM